MLCLRLLVAPVVVVASGAASLLAASPAWAQEHPSGEGDSWQFTLGAGAISGPKYPGSSRSETRAIPLLSASYGRYFLGGAPGAGVPFGIGARLVDTPDWKFGVVLGTDIRKPRQESDDARLTGLGDISATSHVGIFGSYAHDWYGVRANLLTDAGGKHEGTTASVELDARYALTPALMLSAGPAFTWADRKHMQTFFGVDAAQSANSGLAQYAPRAGVDSLRFSIGADYRIDSHWFVGARVAAVSLRGDARNSPITASTSQNTFSIFSGYHF
jgi:outer membrane protein